MEWIKGNDGEAVPDNKAGDSTDGTGEIAVEHPFSGEGEGMTLSPQVNGVEALDGICARVECPPSENFCLEAYNTDDDNQRQKDCAEYVDLTLILCG